MHKKVILLSSFLFLALAVLSGQSYQSPCGTIGEWQEMVVQRLLRNKVAFLENPVHFRDVDYVPIKFHLVAKNDGTGRVSERKVYDQLCAVNEDYLGMGIQFYINDGFNYIDFTPLYDNPTFASSEFKMISERDPASINVFITNNATPPDGQGVTLAFYFPPGDWIVTRRDQINSSNSTLPHELGHFFSLPHPHRGWDAQPWSEAVHGNPAPAISPGGVPTERQNGSNCETAGDRICDTPPDYNGFGWPTCVYGGGAQDPTGELIDPEEHLYMGYFLNCPRDEYIFSDMQQEMIITDLASPQRNFLHSGSTPNTTVIEDAPVLLSPIDGETTPGYNAINLDWSGVAGADFYLLEVDLVPSFSVNPIRLIVYGTSKIIPDLEPNKTYFWRVKPLNAYYTCAPPTSSENFKTGTIVATSDIEFINDWSVSPNPANRFTELSIRIDSENAFMGQVGLFSISGKLVRHMGSRRFEVGQNIFNVPLNGISPGVYIIFINTGEGKLSRRIVIAG